MRLIDADALKRKFRCSYDGSKGDCYAPTCKGCQDNVLLEEDIDEAPTVEQPQWIQCSDRLPTAEDGERVIVHPCFEKPVCEYVFVPWKTVEFEYQVGHIDAWFAIPKYGKRGEGE